MEVSSIFVVLMGLGTVFFGLICIIIICSIMGAICKSFVKEEPAKAPVSAPAAPSGEIANKQEIIAASCAVIAEELGTQISAIKVVSFKRV